MSTNNATPMPTIDDSPQNESCRFSWCDGGSGCEEGNHYGSLAKFGVFDVTALVVDDMSHLPEVSIDGWDYWYMNSENEVETEFDEMIAHLAQAREVARTWIAENAA